MKNKTELSIVNLSTYTSPVVKEVMGKEWIAFGKNNDYFQYLIDRYNGSPTNMAIINGISEMIFGKGLDATDSNRRPDQYAMMVSLFRDEVVRRLCSDLKLMGQCAIQVIYSKDRSRIVKLEHIPVETLRAEKCNEKGEVPAYFYFNDWSKYKKSSELKRIPAFGMSKEGLEIMYIKPYRAGYKYYSPPDYEGGTQYCELEQEISNYHLNNIMNGLAPSMLINMNNGTPDPEQREIIENKIYEKFSGSSNAGKFILAFNDDPATAATIDPIQLSDAHNQYQFLSDESSKKIMVAHRVVSPMLLGVKDNTGFGSNADELKTASILMDNMVIRPFQTLLINAFDQILAYNDIALHLYFKTLQPLEFTDLDNVTDQETREEETGVKLKKIDGQDVYKTKEEAIEKAKELDCEGYHEHQEDGMTWYMPCKDHSEATELDKFIELGENEEDLLKEYDLIDEHEVDYDLEDELDEKIKELNNEVKLASTGRANKTKKSEQDGKSKKKENVTYLVRYMYTKSPKTLDNTREFCRKMMRDKKVYRKEDIIAMSKIPVNAGFGKNGAATYSIWLYKGGARCNHRWTRKIYAKKDGDSFRDAERISTTRAIREGFRPQKNDKKVAIAPRNMKYEGYTAAYWKKMGFTYSNR
tara:strand:+ start:2009 stop:3931 length:1923 start_codon:yes stop_codon:yes gene_type:complete